MEGEGPGQLLRRGWSEPLGEGHTQGDMGELAACVSAASLLEEQPLAARDVQRQGMMAVPHAAEGVGKGRTENEPLQSAAGELG